MKGRTHFLLAAAAFVASTNLACAQSATPPDASTPLLRLEFDTDYNSNVAGSSAVLAAARGIKPVDEYYAPSAVLSLFRQLGAESVFFQGQGGYDFYERNTILNRERIQASGGGNAQISQCQTTLEGSYARHQSDLEDLITGLVENTAEITSGTFDASCNQTGKLVPSLSVSPTWYDNSAALRTSSNYNSIATQGSITYNASSNWDISANGGYTQTEFPNRILLDGSADGYKLYSGGFHVDRGFGEQVKLTFSLSETSLRSDSGSGSNFSGITYDATLTYQPTSRLDGHIEFSRLTTPSNYQGAAYSIDQSYVAGVDYTITSRLKLGVGASYKDQSFKGEAIVTGIDLSDQTVKSGFCSIGFDISPTLSATLTATQVERHADIATYDYSGTQLGLSISKSF